MPKTVSVKTLFLSMAFMLLSFPGFAAQLSYSCSYYQPPTAGATRIPRSAGAAHFVTVPQNPPNGGVSGPLFLVPLNNASGPTGNGCSNPFSGVSYTLVSATIAGGLQGAAQAYAPLPSSAPVWIGTNDIVVTYTYLPGGGGGPCPLPPAQCVGGTAVIDEASDSGSPPPGGALLLDDVFVEVYSPQTATAPDPTLTHDGNYLGAVSTTNQTVKIEADVNPTDPTTGASTGSVFDRWVSSSPGASFAPGERNVNLSANQSGYFLAYYLVGGCPGNYHFVASANLSECVPDNCTASQNWDTATNTCVTCGPSQFWSPADNKCLTATDPCPRTCTFGCIALLKPTGVVGSPGDTLVYVCRKSAGGP
jgi:hypothetical protein